MRVKVGDVFLIPLEGNKHAYAQVATSPLVIFYTYSGIDQLDLQEIVRLPIAFKVFVYKDVLSRGRWKKLGNVILSAENIRIPYMFKQDSITGELSIFHDDFSDTNWERPSVLSECLNLECAAVWDAGHVEERLNDILEGKPNTKWGGEFEIDRSMV